MTPTQRTLAELKRRGLVCGIVERWVPRQPKESEGREQSGDDRKAGGFRLDLFGIIDIIALGPDGVRGLQSCGNSFSQHWNTLTVEKAEESALWLLTPKTSLELWAWRKVKVKRGGKAMRWAPRAVAIGLSDLPVAAVDRAMVRMTEMLPPACAVDKS